LPPFRAVDSHENESSLAGLDRSGLCAATQHKLVGAMTGYVNKSYNTTTIVVRPYNAFSDMSCNLPPRDGADVAAVGLHERRLQQPSPAWPLRILVRLRLAPRYVRMVRQAYYSRSTIRRCSIIRAAPAAQPHWHQGPPPYGYARRRIWAVAAVPAWLWPRRLLTAALQNGVRILGRLSNLPFARQVGNCPHN